jgi:hypothetical protein
MNKHKSHKGRIHPKSTILITVMMKWVEIIFKKIKIKFLNYFSLRLSPTLLAVVKTQHDAPISQCLASNAISTIKSTALTARQWRPLVSQLTAANVSMRMEKKRKILTEISCVDIAFWLSLGSTTASRAQPATQLEQLTEQIARWSLTFCVLEVVFFRRMRNVIGLEVQNTSLL